MKVFTLSPLVDPRWRHLVDAHPKASIFHTAGWLEALRRTYGYEPVVFSTTPPEAELTNGVVFCEVKSWLTGRRLVSLPFSDHCQPLLNTPEDWTAIVQHLQTVPFRRSWKYIELRPRSDESLAGDAMTFTRSDRYLWHAINLRPPSDQLFRKFHESCVRRKIRKAEREGLHYETGTSDRLLQAFYRLMIQTRKRHQLPAQPIAWFRNLLACLGPTATIHLVSRDSEPVASIMTLLHRKSLVYKYGCSDARFNHLGGTPLLFWRAIQNAKELGLEELDLGRSDLEDEGLATFKVHLGGVASELHYYRSSGTTHRVTSAAKHPYLRNAFSCLPGPVSSGLGSLLYRHMG